MTVNTQELRELLEKATPGPWVSRTNGDIGPLIESDDQSDGMMAQVAYADLDNRESNRAYIAAANPATVTALLDEIDALRGERAVLADILRDALGPLRVDLLNAEADGDCEDARDLRAIIERAHAALNPPAPPQGDGA